MTTGVTLYLVSACGTAEEFVAAFRRYADRTGLFIPSSAPLPAGRRGRLALTLKDGGVMIEGEAEILQSSARPSVLHGRPGMTVKFVEPDDLSKTVIAELEKARLAMKPAPPSVPPRPSSVAAEPRPIVPAVGGRIDAANALAECVVIGDATQLVDTASAPRVVTDSGSGKAKFVVPSIPGVGSPRPHSASTPPPLGRPNTPSAPPPLSGVPMQVGASPSGSTARPKTPSVPPDPTSQPLPAPKAMSKLTSIGFPALDKAPAHGTGPKPIIPGVTPVASARAPAENPLLQTKMGTHAPANRPEMPAENATAKQAVDNSTTMGMPALDRAPAIAQDESTTIGEVPPTPPAPAAPPLPPAAAPTKKADPMPAAAPVAAAPAPSVASKPLARPTPESGTPPPATPESGPPANAPSGTPPPGPAPGTLASVKAQRATSIGFPAMRTPFETQPVGTVRPPLPGSGGHPAPPIVPDGATSKSGAGSPGPRGKNPTRQPLSPRHPTPVAPVPIVRPPAKAASRVEDAIVESAIVEEEKTDLSEVPKPPPSGSFAIADTVDAAVDPLANTQISQRSGGMRASEIMAAIPSGDWTMAPDASAPTVVEAAAEGAAPAVVGAAPAESVEEAPLAITSKKPPKGPPTGNWSISLDPETGWSEPVKVEKPAAVPKPAPAPKARKGTGTAGNPDMTISEKGFTAVEWEEKPTGIGEAKIEIDSTLMEPLKPMPDLDDEPADPLSAPPLAGSGPRLPSVADGAAGRPIKYITPPAGLPAAVESPFAAAGGASPFAAGPTPGMPAGPYPTPPSGPAAPMSAATYSNPAMSAPSSQRFASAPPADHSAQFGMMGFAPGAASTPAAAKRRKQTIIIGIGALAALAAGFVLVLVLVGGKTKPASGNAGTGSGSALVEPAGSGSAAVALPGAGSGSAEAAVGSGSAIAEDGSEEEPSGSGAVAVDTPVDAGVPDEPVAAGGPCTVSITSTPKGADVYQDGKKLGSTPLETEMPCGVNAKLTLRKARFINTARSFTPKEGKGNKVVVKLARTTFTLKVTSSPAGATITVGGRSMGVTPATVRLPAYETAAIMVSKPGYATNSKTVTPKSNNISHHVVLKKKSRR